MPAPLTATVAPPKLATQTFPLTVMPVFEIPSAKIKGISGIPTPLKGSMMFPAIFSFGYLLTGGWDTRGRITRGSMSGGEDTKWRKA